MGGREEDTEQMEGRLEGKEMGGKIKGGGKEVRYYKKE